jgi:hypothetical protein
MNFDSLFPANGASDLLMEDAIEVPEEVLARFADKPYPTRSLGHAVRRETEGKYKVKTVDGKVYVIPVA